MRRKDKALPDAAAMQLLEHAEYGVLSTVDAAGQPYGVPLNYVLLDNRLYFHCATTGHKLDNIADNDRVSFCVVGRTRLMPAEFSTQFESVIAFGRAVVATGDERYMALRGLIAKYAPDHVGDGEAYIARHDTQTAVVRIDVEEVTGKAKLAKQVSA